MHGRLFPFKHGLMASSPSLLQTNSVGGYSVVFASTVVVST